MRATTRPAASVARREAAAAIVPGSLTRRGMILPLPPPPSSAKAAVLRSPDPHHQSVYDSNSFQFCLNLKIQDGWISNPQKDRRGREHSNHGKSGGGGDLGQARRRIAVPVTGVGGS